MTVWFDLGNLTSMYYTQNVVYIYGIDIIIGLLLFIAICDGIRTGLMLYEYILKMYLRIVGEK